MQLEYTLREITLVEEGLHNCESLTERIKECPPYIEEVGGAVVFRTRDRKQLNDTPPPLLSRVWPSEAADQHGN